jgi:peptide/nickel transport system substrate-binding protein
MALSTAPLNLDPRQASDATSERINRLIYQRLVAFDEQSMPVPGIASWKRISALHYRFQLNDKTRNFSHGRRLQAQDVVATYRQVLDPAYGSAKRASLSLISSVEQINARTIDFHLSRADPLFPAYLTLNILPEELILSDHEFGRQPVGSGPFELQHWPEPGRLVLRRRDDQQLFEILCVKNPMVRVLKLLRGEVDLVQNDLSPELITYLQSQQGITVTRHSGSNYSYVGFNLKNPFTGDLRVRRAIAYAIDREAIIKWVMRDSARKAKSLFPPEHWVTGIHTSYDYNPRRSREILAQMGYHRKNPLRLTYKTSSDPFRIRLATIFQSQLKNVGIELDLRSYDWGTFFGDIKQGNFQLYSLSWVGIRTPDIYRNIFASNALPPHGANRGRYASQQVDRLLHQAEQAQELSQQAHIYQRIERLIHQDLPYLSLWYEDQVAARNSRIIGYRLKSDGNYDGLAQVRLADREKSKGDDKATAH